MNGQQLRQHLADTLESLKKNEISISEATAIAAVSKEIVRITNTQLKLKQYADEPLAKSTIDFAND